MAQVAIGWVSSLTQKPGMPQIIPLFGAITVGRVKENTTHVLLDLKDLALLDEILARVPVQGHRLLDMLQQFADN
jgi:pyridoxine 4-dehydrogenase